MNLENSTLKKEKYNYTIDIIKGIATILVVITHFKWQTGQKRLFIFPYLVNMAIPVFMVITGYVYALSLDRTVKGSMIEAYRPKVLLKRIIRYTLPLLTIAVWELLDPNIKSPQSPLEVIRWVVNGTHGYGNYYYPVMIQMVFVFPLVWYVFNKKGKTALLLCFLATVTYEFLAWAYMMNDECYRLLSFRYIFTVAAGVFAYKRYKLGALLSGLITAAGALFITCSAYLGYVPLFLNARWALTNCISSMLIIPLMIWTLQNVHLRCKPLEILGKASYHIFLVQMVFYSGFAAKVGDMVPVWYIRLAVGLVICLLTGVIFYYLDKPIQSKMTQLLSDRRKVVRG